MQFQCRLCGCIDPPKKKDTYYQCVECTVCFTKPEKFSIVIEEDEEEKEEILQELESELNEEESDEEIVEWLETMQNEGGCEDESLIWDPKREE